MVLIIATDPQPTAALRRLVSRVGFILLPASVLLIRYYPRLGQAFDPWGGRVFTGVTANKNVLGSVVYIVSLGALWQILSLLRDRKQPNRTPRLLAQCTLLAFGINLLLMANSATSGACFVLGAGVMISTTSLPFIKGRPAAVHTLLLSILLCASLIALLE